MKKLMLLKILDFLKLLIHKRAVKDLLLLNILLNEQLIID